MKKSLVIHIGMGKTGTTALQKFFTAHRSTLADQGIAYPEYGSVVGAHHLLSPHRPPFLINNWEFKPVVEWAPILAALPQEKILISSELMVWAKSDKVLEFCESLAQWFDLKIVIYLRRQDNIIMASYRQQIKAGTQRHKIDTIFDAKIRLFDYEKILTPWSQALGPENIVIRPYERQQFFNQDICRDFLHHVFSIDDFQHLESSASNPNPRLCRIASEYKRLLNNGIKNRERNKKFNKLLMQYTEDFDNSGSEAFSDELILSPKQRVAAIEKNQVINSEIARKYLGRADGSLFLEPLPDTSIEWPGYHISREEAALVTKYIRKKDRELIRWLSRELRKYRRYNLSTYLGLPLSQFNVINPMRYLTKPIHPR